jgi:hypothetical protein
MIEAAAEGEAGRLSIEREGSEFDGLAREKRQGNGSGATTSKRQACSMQWWEWWRACECGHACTASKSSPRKTDAAATSVIHSRAPPPTHTHPTDTPMSFFERLEARVKAVDSLLCVGLDPHAAQVHTYTPPPQLPPIEQMPWPHHPRPHTHHPYNTHSSRKPRAPRPMPSASDSSRRPCRKQRRTSPTLLFLRPLAWRGGRHCWTS